MSWVRLEDSFTSHPKIMELSDADFRVWIRLLCHCAKVKDPSVDTKTRKEVGGLTAGRVKRFESLGLLDRERNSHEVHDWTHYAPKDASSAERVRAFRARRSVTSNDPEALPQPLPPRDRVRDRNEGSGSSSSQNEERFAVQAEANFAANSTPFVALELRPI